MMSLPRPFALAQSNPAFSLGGLIQSRAFHAKLPVPDAAALERSHNGGAPTSVMRPHEIVARLEELRKQELAGPHGASETQKTLFTAVTDLWPHIPSMEAIDPFLQGLCESPDSSYLLSCMLYLKFADFLDENSARYIKEHPDSIYQLSFMDTSDAARHAAGALVDDFMDAFAWPISAATYVASQDQHYLGRLIGSSVAAMAYKYRYRDRWLSLTIERGLADDDMMVVYAAANESYKDYKPDIVCETDSFNQRSVTPESSPDFGIERYHYVRGMRTRPRTAILHAILFSPHSTIRKAYVPAKSIRPIHSLADYEPNAKRRQDVMKAYYNKLEQLIDAHGPNRKKILSELFYDPELVPSIGPLVIRFAPGQYYLADGHHRVAAFVKAALDGLIPREWLDKPIPVRRVDYRPAKTPTPLVRYFLTLGVKLGWQDLLPGDTDFTGLPELTERDFGRATSRRKSR